MVSQEVHLVTGAYGYTGKYITRRLLALGHEVRTLTNHPQLAQELQPQIKTYPLDFTDQAQLIANLEGVTTLYNTYWIRFAYGSLTYEQAVANSRLLIQSAEKAGVKRLVHVSITNPSEDSPFPYFKGKAQIERAIRESTLSYAIIRPTVIYGDEDILINNIAWLIRRFPFFPIFGDGSYRLQPIYVEDMADLVVQAGEQRDNSLIDATGPDVFRFEELVRLIASTLRRRLSIFHVAPGISFSLAKLIQPFVGDVLITRDEIDGLMANLLISQNPPTGKAHLAEWLSEHVDQIGRVYASELQRHYR